MRSHRPEHNLYKKDDFSDWVLTDGFYDPYRKDRFMQTCFFRKTTVTVLAPIKKTGKGHQGRLSMTQPCWKKKKWYRILGLFFANLPKPHLLMIRFTAINPKGSINLLDEDEPHQLVGEGHP